MNKTLLTERQLAIYAKWLNKVTEFITANMSSRNLTVGDIADAVFMSERQFYRRIKKVTGLTPHQYLKKLKLEKAKILLDSGSYSSLKEVVYAIGYSRSDYFSTLFESYYGIKPSSYFQS
jgi:AraC-like DNA-binding protein